MPDLVERDPLSGSAGLGGGERYAENGVSSHVSLVIGAVFCQHGLVGARKE